MYNDNNCIFGGFDQKPMRVNLATPERTEKLIDARKLNEAGRANLLKVSLTRKLVENSIDLPPATIEAIGKMMVSFDPTPYVNIFGKDKNNKSLINLLVEDISLRIYIAQCTNYKREYIFQSVNYVIGKYSYKDEE